MNNVIVFVKLLVFIYDPRFLRSQKAHTTIAEIYLTILVVQVFGGPASLAELNIHKHID